MNLWQDLRHAVRLLGRSPGFTAVAVVTLALAIGANAAVFSIVDALLLRPLPLPDSQSLVQVLRFYQGGGSPFIALPRFLAWRERNEVFSKMAAFDNLGSGFNLVSDGPPERLVGSRVSRDFFDVVQVKPFRGRDFLAEEDRPAARRVVILSYDLWRRRFGADESWVGRQMVLNGESYTVVGIMPDGFRFPAKAELWTPVQLDPSSQEKASYLEVVGRLKPQASLAQAQAAMRVIDKAFVAAHPDIVERAEDAVVKPVQERLYGHLKTTLLVLLAAVLGVLLIACVNLANLQLARGAGRQREIALRIVLGAAKSRIVVQLLIESVVLALLGGAAGVALGYAALPSLLAASPTQIDRLAPIGLDARVLLFTLLLSAGAGVLFGLVPALGASRTSLAEPLKEGTSRSTDGVKGARVRRLLVGSEVAIALVLITSAALLVKSFAGLLRTDTGFSADHVLALKLALPQARYGTGQALDGLSGQLVERLAGLPGVEAGAVATGLPMERGLNMPFAIEGRYTGGAVLEQAGVGDAQFRAVTADLFKALRIPVLAGRGFTAGDRRGTQPVALINEAAAREFWPKQNPVGQRITVGLPIADLADPAARTIVGVVRDVRDLGVDEKATSVVYVPMGQLSDGVAVLVLKLLQISVAVRAQGDPANLSAAVQKAIWAVDPQQPIASVATMEEIVGRSLGQRRFSALLFSLLATIALLLAAVGIYGVLSYLVGQRTREIGIRMALGARGGDVLRLVVRQGLGAVLLGVAVGLLGAFLLTRLLKGMLYGVSATDPSVFFLTPAILTAVALVAAAVPARRASRLDPVVALAET
ncbi:MAG TPA: ABC transporter permease [Thermoanaerobaculia bacterium]